MALPSTAEDLAVAPLLMGQMSCDPGLKHRGLGCGSSQSIAHAPTYVDEISGSVTYTQPMRLDPWMCHTYLVVRALRDLRTMGVISETLMALVAGSSPDCILHYTETSDVLNVNCTSHASEKWDGVIVCRPLSVNSELLDTSVKLRSMLSRAGWWIVPISVDELLESSFLPQNKSHSRVMLLVVCGCKCEIMCLVGHKQNSYRNFVWDMDEKAKVGWYNKLVRPIRVAPC